MIRFKDLCLDAVDAARAAVFWAPALGLTIEHRGASAKLVGATDEQTLWINGVPEPITVKQRAHLDLHVAAVADLVALGATVIDESQPWTVLTDPEGGEVCAFVRAPDALPDYRLYELVVDAADPAAIAGWWAEQYAVEPHHESEHGFSWLEPPSMPFGLVFGRVPEPKTVKNRIHPDVWGEPGPLLDAGARLLRARDDEIEWDVLADPEGNEFCVFAPRAPQS